MGQLLACMITRADLLQAAVVAEAEHLGPLPERIDGWGVGFFHAGEVLHKKRPMYAPEPLSWPALFEGLSSSVAIAHLREGTVGDARADNTHPFRMRQWLFAHVGSVEGFANMRSNLLSELPDFLQRNMRGDTDSEHVFHIVLSFLHDAGQLDAPDPNPVAVLSAVRSTVSLMDRYAREIGAPTPKLNLALTNGRDLYLLRRGTPLYLVERDHLPSDEGVPEGRSVGPVRYIMAHCGSASPAPSGYHEIPEGHLLHVDRELAVVEHELGH